MAENAKRMGRPAGEPSKVVRLPLPVAALAKRLAEKRRDFRDRYARARPMTAAKTRIRTNEASVRTFDLAFMCGHHNVAAAVGSAVECMRRCNSSTSSSRRRKRFSRMMLA